MEAALVGNCAACCGYLAAGAERGLSFSAATRCDAVKGASGTEKAAAATLCRDDDDIGRTEGDLVTVEKDGIWGMACGSVTEGIAPGDTLAGES